MEERSLDDFLDAGDEAVGEKRGDEAADETQSDGVAKGERSDGAANEEDREAAPAEDDSVESTTPAPGEEGVAVDPAAVEPATTTSRYAPGGAACEDCDEESTRLWIDEERIVCRACKSW
jgi:formylmethanofuran dehydrogenase subunit E